MRPASTIHGNRTMLPTLLSHHSGLVDEPASVKEMAGGDQFLLLSHKAVDITPTSIVSLTSSSAAIPLVCALNYG